MLCTAHATDHAGRAAKQLRYQPVNVIAIHQKVTMGAMVGEDHIPGAVQGVDYAHGAGFLADRGVDGAREQPLGK